MAGLVPAIHAFLARWSKDVDARHKAGHDERGAPHHEGLSKVNPWLGGPLKLSPKTVSIRNNY